MNDPTGSVFDVVTTVVKRDEDDGAVVGIMLVEFEMTDVEMEGMVVLVVLSVV